MRYGFTITGGDIRAFPNMAREIEAAGWDGIFIPDCIYIEGTGENLGFDPWVALASMAVVTEKVILGTMITPPSRRRPWKLAREVASLDLLSNGRMVLPVGLGALDDKGFGGVGDVTDRKERAELLDESLAILAGLWSGEPFSFEGKHYKLAEMQFLPTPVQRPRVPIWVVGLMGSEKSMGRAVEWDGLLPNVPQKDGQQTPVLPEDIAAMRKWASEHREPDAPYDIITEGVTLGDNPDEAAAKVRPYAKAGATWWLEADWSGDSMGNVEKMLARIRQGPPRV